MYIILFITFTAGLPPSNVTFTGTVEMAGGFCILLQACLDFIGAKKFKKFTKILKHGHQTVTNKHRFIKKKKLNICVPQLMAPV